MDAYAALVDRLVDYFLNTYNDDPDPIATLAMVTEDIPLAVKLVVARRALTGADVTLFSTPSNGDFETRQFLYAWMAS